jgi:hypothetical protein
MLTWGEGLARTDPAALNLEVAKGIPDCAALQVEPYCRFLDQAAARFKQWLPEAEREFGANPEGWGSDLARFRLRMLCQFIEQCLGIDYNEDQRSNLKIEYTNPGDLFLNGVLDTRRGTCGNMAVLYVALCWRLGWPVFLAMTRWHVICRYHDGQRTVNIEPSCIGRGGFSTPEDDVYIKEDKLTPEDISSGSDLSPLTARQSLGVFFGLRGRYWHDRRDALCARDDYQRATTLFPQSRLWREKYQYVCQLASEISVAIR